MKILVIGAKLQGMEAIYLAKKAGYEVTVLDRNPEAPGVDLAHHYANADLLNEAECLPYFQAADVILPAIENKEMLTRIMQYGKKAGKPVAFDEEAYEISSSKHRSDQLFRDWGVPMPDEYPHCSFPVFLKPDGRSGSEGTCMIRNQAELDQALIGKNESEWVVQQYIEGRSYSLEVIGNGRDNVYPLITEVIPDTDYDCKRIVAPAEVTEDIRKQMYRIGSQLAEALSVKGIFDIEVLEDEGRLRVLEIDARLPSQTPISVYQATGINMVQLLAESALGKPLVLHPTRNRACLYQQVSVEKGVVTMVGEHCMAGLSHLRYFPDFFGIGEAITDYRAGKEDWHAILILTRDTVQEAEMAFQQFVHAAAAAEGIMLPKTA